MRRGGGTVGGFRFDQMDGEFVVRRASDRSVDVWRSRGVVNVGRLVRMLAAGAAGNESGSDGRDPIRIMIADRGSRSSVFDPRSSRRGIMQSLRQDLRYGARMLLKKPVFTLIAILTLSLGIGANTAIFSLVNTALLRPLPVERPNQLVSLNNVSLNLPVISYPNYRDFRDRNNLFSGIVAFRYTTLGLSNNGVNERIWGYLATGNYFEVLGVRPALGRFFTPDDDRGPGAHPVAVITYDCWQKRFAGDPKVIDKTVIVNGRNFTIIGVAPKGFYGSEIIYRPEIWFPTMMQEQIEGWSALEARGEPTFFAQGRLKPAVTMSQAEAELKNMAAQLAGEFPNENEGMTVTLSPAGLLGAWMRGPITGFAVVLMAVVGLVLLLACTNLANLLLARAAERRKEI